MRAQADRGTPRRSRSLIAQVRGMGLHPSSFSALYQLLTLEAGRFRSSATSAIVKPSRIKATINGCLRWDKGRPRRADTVSLASIVSNVSFSACDVKASPSGANASAHAAAHPGGAGALRYTTAQNSEGGIPRRLANASPIRTSSRGKSAGGFTAGDGSVTNYARQVDSSQAAITKAFRDVHWYHKVVSHHAGLGFDILTRHKDGFPVFLEIKSPGPPSSRRLTESEIALRDAFPQFFRLATTPAEAFSAVGLG